MMPEGIQCDRCGEFETHGIGGGKAREMTYESDGWPGGPMYVVHIDDPSLESNDPVGRPCYTLCEECRREIVIGIERNDE